MSAAPVCPYCGHPASLLPESAALYHGREFGPVWLCSPCLAWVRCHPGTTRPLGTLADRDLRRARTEAHRAFDALWQARLRRGGCRRGEARNRAYAWLAGRMGLPFERCHMGLLDLGQCRRVVAICARLGPAEGRRMAA